MWRSAFECDAMDEIARKYTCQCGERCVACLLKGSEK